MAKRNSVNDAPPDRRANGASELSRRLNPDGIVGTDLAVDLSMIWPALLVCTMKLIILRYRVRSAPHMAVLVRIRVNQLLEIPVHDPHTSGTGERR